MPESSLPDAEPTFLPLTAEQADHACAVLKLPPQLRTFVRLGCVEGKTLDEIATAMDLTAEQVVGLRDDLSQDLEGLKEDAPRAVITARDLLSFFRGFGSRDHGPNLAASRYDGTIQEVTLRGQILNEADLGDRFCRNCRHWDGPEHPDPHPGTCGRGVSEFENPDDLTTDYTFVYVRNGKVYGCAGVTTPGFTCPFWQGHNDWRTEPADVLGRSRGERGLWRQKTRSAR